jgi:hypothetical protein
MRSDPNGETGEHAVWTLQQFDEVNGEPWCALLLCDRAGIVRGWTGYRPEIAALARIFNITPQELPPTTAQDFFLRTNITSLRPPPVSSDLDRQTEAPQSGSRS